jgi:aspartyl-tRNA(Asn)/glutamyl-tRNA(Gln) amidotransferase subunit B
MSAKKGIPAGWEVVIGLETHTQLSTASKIFSGSPTAFGAEPNTQASVIDLALPGTLPVLNKAAVECAIKFGLAVNGGDDKHIAPRSVFARKNYFYPDLPKGYQISQFELPVVTGGSVTINVDGTEKIIQLTRAHLEEDAGKSLHEGMETSGVSGIDLNRAGTPLLEIVSEPDMRSAEEAVAYAKELHGIVVCIGICDGNMQEGSFRCDANVSVRRAGETKLGTRAEIKNVNSFRFLEKAINYEIRRQIELIEDGGKVVQETRLYDAERDETRSMRSKEDAMDYRYFPDPDLLPVEISRAQIDEIRDQLPLLPAQHKLRFTATSLAEVQNVLMKQLNIDDEAELDVAMTKTMRAVIRDMQQRGKFFALKAADADNLAHNPDLAGYLDEVVSILRDHDNLAANWVIGELSSKLNESGLKAKDAPIQPSSFAQLVLRVADGTISATTAKTVFRSMWDGEGEADAIIAAKGLKQVSDAGAIEKMIDDVIAANPKSVEEYRAGKEKALNALFGQVMKASNKTANPAQVTEILKRKLAG